MLVAEKNVFVQLRIDEGLKQHLEREAKKLGLNLSAYVRMKLIELTEFEPDLNGDGD